MRDEKTFFKELNDDDSPLHKNKYNNLYSPTPDSVSAINDDYQFAIGVNHVDLHTQKGDLLFSLKHAWANKVGYDNPNTQPYFCQCCKKNVEKLEYNLNCTNDELASLGLGYP